VFCAPGNGGIADEAECFPADVKSIDSLSMVAAQISPDLTIVGPELPLALGVVDEFTRRGGVCSAQQGSSAVGVKQEFCQEISAKASHPHGSLCNLRFH